MVEGQTDILTMGLPYISPYNVNSILNPILVACLGLGYFFNLYRGKPLVREGGVLIMTHPTPWEFNPVHHPSYIDFFEQVLSETTDPNVMSERFEEAFATDPWYIHLYRTGHAYHGVHPFYMWYWCAHALQHLGAVDHRRRRRQGRAPSRVPVGLHPGRRPRDGPRRGRPLPHPDPPARPADPDGRRPVSAAPAEQDPGTSSLRSRRAVRTDAALGDRPAAGRWRRPRTPPALRRPGRPGAGSRWPHPPGPARCPAPPPSRSSGAHYDTAWSRRYPVRLARAVVLDNVTRPLARVLASPAAAGRGGAGRPRGTGDLRRQPRQPRRHPAAAGLPAPALPPPHGGGRGGRLLLRPPMEGRRLLVPARGHPHRADQGQPPLRRPGRRAAGRRLEPGHLPRGRPLARRLGPGVPRRCRLPGGRAPAARWCRSTSTAPATSCPRAAARCAAPGPPSPSARRCGPTEGEDARRFGRASRPRWPPWPTRPTTDWWTARRQAAAGHHPAAPGPDVAGLAPVVGAGSGARAGTDRRRRRQRSGPADADDVPRQRTGHSTASRRRTDGPVTARPARRLPARPSTASRRSARSASSSWSSSGSSSASRPGGRAGRRQRPPEQQVGQRRVAGQHRAVEVGAEHPPGPGALGAVAAAVAHPPHHPGQRPGPGPDRGHPAVVLEAGQAGQRAARRPVAGRRPAATATSSPTARRAGALAGGHVEQARAPRGAGRRRRGRSGRPAGTRRTPPAPPRRAATRSARVPSSSRAVGRPHLGPVLAPADAVDVGRGQRPVRRGLDQLDVDPPPGRPAGQDQPVAPVAVGAEQVGVDHGDGQARPAPLTAPAAGRRRRCSCRGTRPVGRSRPSPTRPMAWSRAASGPSTTAWSTSA